MRSDHNGEEPSINADDAESLESQRATCEDFMRRVNASPRAKKRLEELLLEGLSSGDPIEATPEYWEEMRQRYPDGT